MKDTLKKLFDKYQIAYQEQQIILLEKYYKIVITENEKFNLTTITEKNDFALKHILDCCLIVNLIDKNCNVLDIGSGAGFPGIPLKIMREDLNIILLDSVNKKVNFLNETINKLSLKNIVAIHDRAEDFAKSNREKFDVVCSRAVANLSTLSEYCLPFTKVNGKFIALKGSNYEEEIEQGKNAIKLLGGKIEDIKKVEIEEIQAVRANLIISKISPTPKTYPRGKNLPRLKPLF